jgi:hypothetical protein
MLISGANFFQKDGQFGVMDCRVKPTLTDNCIAVTVKINGCHSGFRAVRRGGQTFLFTADTQFS